MFEDTCSRRSTSSRTDRGRRGRDRKRASTSTAGTCAAAAPVRPEETTSGVIRLKAMERGGALEIPSSPRTTLSASTSSTTGTGRASQRSRRSSPRRPAPRGRPSWFGYGQVGKGLALYCRGFGARVSSWSGRGKALEAASNGFEVRTMIEAAPQGTSSDGDGLDRVLRREHFAVMKGRALLANAGNYSHEIDVAALFAPRVDNGTGGVTSPSTVLADGLRIHLLVRGALQHRGVRRTPRRDHGLSFSWAALPSTTSRGTPASSRRVHPLPADIDEEIARARLDLLGMRLEETTTEQREYGRSWR